MQVLPVTDDTFEACVLKKLKPSVVLFWHEGCPFCKALKPTINAIEEEIGDMVNFLSIAAMDNPKSTTAYGVTVVPTMALFKDGKMIDSIVGEQPKEKLLEMIKTKLGL